MWLNDYAQRTMDGVPRLFPVRRHSYVPPDRLFGGLELQLMRQTAYCLLKLIRCYISVSEKSDAMEETSCTHKHTHTHTHTHTHA